MSSSLAPAAFSFASGMARAVARANVHAGVNNRIAPRLIDSLSKDVVDDIFVHALKKQTGVRWGCHPIACNLNLYAHHLHLSQPFKAP